MLLVFQGVPQLQTGGPVMQRDRFRSLTHCWDEYRRRRQDGACWRGGMLCGMKREEAEIKARLKTSRKMKSMWDLNKNGTKKHTEHRKVKSAVMEGEEHNRTDCKVNDEHEEDTYRHERTGGAEGAMGEKETCGEEEKLERGGN